MSDRSVTCERLDELLLDYLEDALDAQTRSVVDEHVAACARCATLVADLRTIEREAHTLPTLEPPRDLWDGIAARIEAPVVALDAPRERARRRSSHWRLGAAAAALVALTAGVTYTVTVNAVRGPREVAAGGQADRRTGEQADRPPEASGRMRMADDARAESVGDMRRRVPGDTLTRIAVRTAPRVLAEGTPPRAQSAGATARVASTQTAEATYDREIERLRAIIEQRRSRLDPGTVAIIEYNLKVIDDAIMQSRTALAKDPASGFLSEQLNSALDKKLTLLRTAALLPART